MIIIVKSNDDDTDWPEFWALWKKATLVMNKGKLKQLNKLIESVNYKVCPKCGAEYAVVFQNKSEQDNTFTCSMCGKIVKPDNYNNKYFDAYIKIAQMVDLEVEEEEEESEC